MKSSLYKKVLVVITLALLVGCSNDPNRQSGEPLLVLEQASVAFNGNPSPVSIKAKLDEALCLYNIPISAENYSRAASTLITLRKSNGTDEMLILDYMIRSYVPGVTPTFPEMAALSSVMLRVGDK